MTTEESLEKLEKDNKKLKNDTRYHTVLYNRLWRLFYDTLGQQNKFCKEDHKRLENLEVLEWLVARLQSTVEDLVQDNHMQSTVSKTTVTSAPRYAKKGDLYE